MNQNGEYVSMKSALPTFICGLRIDKSRISTNPTFDVTYLNPVDLHLSSDPTFPVTRASDENLVFAIGLSAHFIALDLPNTS